jgi:hypothetical protein
LVSGVKHLARVNLKILVEGENFNFAEKKFSPFSDGMCAGKGESGDAVAPA